VAIPMKKLHPAISGRKADEDQIIYSSKNDDEEARSRSKMERIKEIEA
jgi:hypothetical protein